MNKKLNARKCKDAWHVTITETHIIPTLTDVKKLIRYEGLKYKGYLGTEDKGRIYAE